MLYAAGTLRWPDTGLSGAGAQQQVPDAHLPRGHASSCPAGQRRQRQRRRKDEVDDGTVACGSEHRAERTPGCSVTSSSGSGPVSKGSGNGWIGPAPCKAVFARLPSLPTAPGIEAMHAADVLGLEALCLCCSTSYLTSGWPRKKRPDKRPVINRHIPVSSVLRCTTPPRSAPLASCRSRINDAARVDAIARSQRVEGGGQGSNEGCFRIRRCCRMDAQTKKDCCHLRRRQLRVRPDIHMGAQKRRHVVAQPFLVVAPPRCLFRSSWYRLSCIAALPSLNTI